MTPAPKKKPSEGQKLAASRRAGQISAKRNPRVLPPEKAYVRGNQV